MSMRTFPRSDEKHVQDWASLASAVLLFLSPWALRFADANAAARTAWISAVVIAIFSISAIVQFKEWEEWVAMVLGVWLLVAPWIVGFAMVSYAVTAFVVFGIVILVASLSELWSVHHPTSMAS